MDAEKWKKITATFSFTSPEHSMHNSGALCSNNQLDVTDDKLRLGPNSIALQPTKLPPEVVDRISVACCGFPQHISLQKEVEQLRRELHKKCQLIEVHQNTIVELRAVVDKFRRHYRGRKNAKNVEDPTLQHEAYAEQKPVGVRARGKVRHPNAPGNSSLQNISSDPNLKQSFRNSVLAKPTPANPTNILPLVAEKLDKLERHMEDMMKKLPVTVKRFCQDYISKCRFKYNEDTQEICLVLDQQKSAISSPKIKPKSNASFDLRSKKNALRIDQQREEAATKDDIGIVKNKPISTDCKVTLRLKRLEGLVEELKSSFVQLLVDRVKCKSKPSKDPITLPKLTKRLSKFQELHCTVSS